MFGRSSPGSIITGLWTEIARKWDSAHSQLRVLIYWCISKLTNKYMFYSNRSMYFTEKSVLKFQWNFLFIEKKHTHLLQLYMKHSKFLEWLDTNMHYCTEKLKNFQSRTFSNQVSNSTNNLLFQLQFICQGKHQDVCHHHFIECWWQFWLDKVLGSSQRWFGLGRFLPLFFCSLRKPPVIFATIMTECTSMLSSGKL